MRTVRPDFTSAVTAAVRRGLRKVDRTLGIRDWLSQDVEPHALAGDRAIEWSWIVTRLPRLPCRVLDLGCVQAPLTAVAARLGHCVTAIDLRDIEYDMESVDFRKCDITQISGEAFDIIMNCSMIEHVGLPGRYGEVGKPDGDLAAMQQLRHLLAPGGLMLMTIPVGRDAVISPHHRVYGENRLPRLLSCYTVIEEEYWCKGSSWQKTDKNTSIAVVASESFYALGLFTLGANT